MTRLVLLVAALTLASCTFSTGVPTTRIVHVYDYPTSPRSCGDCCSPRPSVRHPRRHRDRHVADYEPRRDPPKKKHKHKRAKGERRRAAWGLR